MLEATQLPPPPVQVAVPLGPAVLCPLPDPATWTVLALTCGRARLYAEALVLRATQQRRLGVAAGPGIRIANHNANDSSVVLGRRDRRGHGVTGSVLRVHGTYGIRRVESGIAEYCACRMVRTWPKAHVD